MSRRYVLVKIRSLVLLAMTLSLLGIVAIAWSASTYLTSPYEITRIRNSLLASAGSREDFNWMPDSPPQGFRQETMSPPPEFSRLVAELSKNTLDSSNEWTRALSIARHLGSSPGTGNGIMSSTYDTYEKIMTHGNGYCADFTQVFNGIAHAAGIPVREWGMSFDGFGGNGHAMNEIYDHELGKWILIDSFYSLYFTGKKTGEPLSVIELQDFLRRENYRDLVSVQPVDDDRFSFRNASQALDYYRQGADQFYLWFGNDVFTYDNHILRRFFGRFGRAVEQAIMIIMGQYPSIKIVTVPGNEGMISKLTSVRIGIIMYVVVLVGLSVIFLAGALYLRRNTSR